MLNCGVVDLWICGACGSAEPVDPRSLWIYGVCRSVEPVDPQSLWIHGACGSAEPVDLWSLWICGACGSAEACGSVEPCGSTEPVDLWSLVDPQSLVDLQSPGSTEYAFQKCKTNDIMFDVYRFSNMILANEHRSLGPIFNFERINFLKSSRAKFCLLACDIIAWSIELWEGNFLKSLVLFLSLTSHSQDVVTNKWS